jgi:hypothetical protein
MFDESPIEIDPDFAGPVVIDQGPIKIARTSRHSRQGHISREKAF